jgi:hypothetical protein
VWPFLQLQLLLLVLVLPLLLWDQSERRQHKCDGAGGPLLPVE